MPRPQYEDLPFNARPDLTPYLLHLTKRSDDESAYENLVSILEDGEIHASDRRKGKIKGTKSATCFMDVPFASLKYVLTPEATDPQRPFYEPYGLAITKKTGYGQGCRPVLHLSNPELKKLDLPRSEQWRVVRLEVSDDGWICWLHDREWRCKGDFDLPRSIQAAFVKTPKEAEKLTAAIYAEPKRFKCRPRSIIPMSLLCQGLLKKPKLAPKRG